MQDEDRSDEDGAFMGWVSHLARAHARKLAMSAYSALTGLP